MSSDGTPDNVSVVLSVSDPAAAFAFWQTALPSSGYTITSSGAVGAPTAGAYGLNFTGNGYRQGHIGIATLLPGQSTVAITLQR